MFRQSFKKNLFRNIFKILHRNNSGYQGKKEYRIGGIFWGVKISRIGQK